VAAEVQRVHVEPCQFRERPWGEHVAARLVPSRGALLDDGDVMTRAGEPGGHRRPGGTAADDEDVGVQGAFCQPAGEPGIASGPTGMISAPPRSGTSGEV
jgi:hypothetical protein